MRWGENSTRPVHNLYEYSTKHLTGCKIHVILILAGTASQTTANYRRLRHDTQRVCRIQNQPLPAIGDVRPPQHLCGNQLSQIVAPMAIIPEVSRIHEGDTMKRLYLDNPEIETALDQIKEDLAFKTDSALIEQLIRERAIGLTILPSEKGNNGNQVKEFNG